MDFAPSDAVHDSPALPLPDCGQRVSVESARHTEKLWTHMIGFKPGVYLVLEKPPGTDAVDGKRALKDGDSLVIRFLKEGSIYGFRVPVLCTATMPYRLLFVGFPIEVAEHSLRSSPRLECYLPCEGEVGGRSFSRAFIRDFSATGCQLRIPLDAFEDEDEHEDESAHGLESETASAPTASNADARVASVAAAPEDSAANAEPNAAPAPPESAEVPLFREPSAQAEALDGASGALEAPDENAAFDENRLSLILQLPGDDEIRIAHGDVLDWQTLPRFHQLRVKFDEPQAEIFEQLTHYTMRLG